MAFGAEVRGAAPVVVLAMVGDLDGTAEERLADVHERAAALDPTTVVLNFDGVNYINSTGIALLVGLLAQARRRGWEVRAVGLSRHYQHIFEITRIADFMAFYDDERSAMAGSAAGA